MAPPLQLSPEAEFDLVAAYDWYEAQRSGLGSEFLAAIAQILTQVERNPLQYPVVRGQTRRAIVRRFPYAVLYIAEPDVITVTAVFHGRRDPQRWLERPDA